MRLISTTGNSRASLHEAVLHSLAPDGSLYIPEVLPSIPRAFFNNMSEMSLPEIGYVVANTLLGEDIPAYKLKTIAEEAFSFDTPIVPLDERVNIIELFHGPTLAFKDIGARFLSRVLHEIPCPGRAWNVIVATTGNTGAAVANACLGDKSLNAIILYPAGAMRRTQLCQFTTLGDNVWPVEVAGTIDDCKAIIREIFTDTSDISREHNIVCANTVNILRLLPQIAYFFYAWSRLRHNDGPVDFAIPSGNLSNLTAAVMAKKMGLPAGRLIAGCNASGTILPAMLSGTIPDHAATHTLAAAMDSGHPTNIQRLSALYGGSVDEMRRDIEAHVINDSDIAATMLSTGSYAIDPHTAVALAALRRSQSRHIAAILATAHPVKSLDTMTAVTGRATELPLQLTRFMARPQRIIKLAPTMAALKKYVLDKLS